MAITQAQMRMLQRRRTTDIDRLAQQYSKNVQAMTGEYQTAFSDYQGRVAEQMKPFEEQLAKYKAADMPAYEEAKAKYQQQLDAYNAQLKAIEAEPGTYRNERVMVGRTWYGKKQYEDVQIFEPKPVPTLEAKMPEAPTAPTPPTVEKFDTAPFEQRRDQLQSDLQREIGERKAGRMAAVSRRSQRSMLQGA